MSLRRKLLMVLLLTAVLPMLAVRAVQAVSIYRVQSEIADDMRKNLTDEAERDMLRIVDGYARSLDQEANLVFALLQVQAGEVERRLNGPPPADPPRVPTPRAFRRLVEEDPNALELVLSERHAVVNAENDFEPLAISYTTQVVVPPREQRLNPRENQDLARLADMSAAYRKVYEQANDAILWQYTALESGLHFSYPGKAGFPAGFAPRKRPWYRQAVTAGRPIGTRPFVDAATRQLIVTFAQPVRDSSGEIAGVTAIDLPVSRLLDTRTLRTDWAEQAELVVVAAHPSRIDDADADRFDLGPDLSVPADVYVVLDLHQDPDNRRGRMRHMRTETLGFDRDEQRQAVTDDLINVRNGVRRVSINGEDQMIAYGRIGAGNESRPVFAMILAPTQTIHAPAEMAIAELESDLRESLVTTGGILVGLLVVVGLIAFGLSFRLTRPIVELAAASRRVAQGDLQTRVDLKRRDEIGQLGEAFNEMVPALRDRMKIRESLAVAMQVQQSLLPSAPPSVPGLDIAGHSEYCDETGGDYYDFIQLDKLGPNTLAVAVGDVTGHGIAAALLMATGRALIRSHANTTNPLGEVFTKVNRQLCDSEFTGRFMTLMYLILQVPEQAASPDQPVHIRYLSAGHDPVIVYRPGEDRFLELAGRDIPLGIDNDWGYNEEQSDDVRPGDILVLGTDGIWECFNPDNQQFGKDRLRETIRAASTQDAQSIAYAISKACRHWRGGTDQTDDITLVVVKLDA